jgi:predicted DNA-binding transcriptional regulator AlpA
MSERKIMNIADIVQFTGMSRRTIYNRMAGEPPPFRWFMENGRRTAYSDDVKAWFYSELAKADEIQAARVEEERKKDLDREERRCLRDEELKQKNVNICA